MTILTDVVIGELTQAHVLEVLTCSVYIQYIVNDNIN